MDAYLERAVEERANDYAVVREWVFEQMRRDPTHLAAAVASILCPTDPQWQAQTMESVRRLKLCMNNDVAAQPATIDLAERFREDDEEEEREAAIEAAREAAYVRECNESIPNIPVW